MIDIENAKISFEKFIDQYQEKNHPGFNLKVTHIYHVAKNAKKIATELNLSKEDIALAELIGLLHDIGRFEEIKQLNQFNSVKFDHASFGVRMLFKDQLIREFIENDHYDEIIKNAIDNHSRLSIKEGLDDRSLLHVRIIRDADKLDNFRVKKEESIQSMYHGIIQSKEEVENSAISNKVYETIKKKKCIDIHDRKTSLDYFICVLAFVFDLNFEISRRIVKQNHYIDHLIDQFEYKNNDTKRKMDEIKKILNDFLKY